MQVCQKAVCHLQSGLSAALTAYIGYIPVSISYAPATASTGTAFLVSIQFPPNNQVSAQVGMTKDAIIFTGCHCTKCHDMLLVSMSLGWEVSGLLKQESQTFCLNSCNIWKEKKDHIIFPANLGLIRCLVPHGRGS